MADNRVTGSTDHDILITLVQTVNNNHTSVMEKISDVKSDVSEIKVASMQHILDLETRVKVLERFMDHSLVYRSMIAVLAGVIGSLITLILSSLNILRFFKN